MTGLEITVTGLIQKVERLERMLSRMRSIAGAALPSVRCFGCAVLLSDCTCELGDIAREVAERNRSQGGVGPQGEAN